MATPNLCIIQVELDSVALQQLDRLHDPSPRALAAPVEAVGVVDRLRAVETDADQEVVALERLAPALVEQCRIGLK